MAIQGSSVASERAFSSAGLTDTMHRNRLIPEAFGQIQILKNAYKTNFLTATSEIGLHPVVETIHIK